MRWLSLKFFVETYYLHFLKRFNANYVPYLAKQKLPIYSGKLQYYKRAKSNSSFKNSVALLQQLFFLQHKFRITWLAKT
jgi:hypothetical protein